MSNIQTTITPHNQNPFVTRTYPSENELDNLIAKAVIAQKAWSAVSVEDRVAIGRAFMVIDKITIFIIKNRVSDTKKRMNLGRWAMKSRWSSHFRWVGTFLFLNLLNFLWVQYAQSNKGPSPRGRERFVDF